MSKQQDPVTPRQEKKEGKQFYIDQVRTWDPINRKCEEVQEFVNKFHDTLIHNEEAAKDLVEAIRQEVERLNVRYPWTMPLEVREIKEFGQVYCQSIEGRNSYPVFFFCIKEMRHHYSIDNEKGVKSKFVRRVLTLTLVLSIISSGILFLLSLCTFAGVDLSGGFLFLIDLILSGFTIASSVPSLVYLVPTILDDEYLEVAKRLLDRSTTAVEICKSLLGEGGQQ